MHPRQLNPTVFVVAVAGLLACGVEPTATPTDGASFARGGVPPAPGAATFEYHAGDAFLGSINPAFAPDKATAPNGDVLELSGSGSLSVYPNAVTGGGTFTHKDANGNVRGSGTWAATQLLSFQNDGGSPLTPATFRSGVALIRVHLTAGGGAVELDGTLRISCHLPQTDVPGGFVEGIRLAVDGAVNFNHEAGGATVFIVTP